MGKPNWLSPEQFQPKKALLSEDWKFDGEKADVYSCGIVLLYLRFDITLNREGDG
jgi:hypothetical protein